MGQAVSIQRLDGQRFHDVFNASPIGIAVENLEGQPLFVNPAFCSMLGFSEEELRSKHCVDFSPPEDAERDWALFQQLRAGSIDHYQLEKRYFRRDGSLVWGRLSVSLLNSRPSPLVVALVEDITDKRTAEEAVGASEERLRLAQQVARIGTFERNVQTGVVTWTPEMESIYGLPPGGFGQTQAAFENLLYPDDRATVMELVDGALKTGQPTMGEWRVLWPDGSIHWVAGRWQAFMNESGEPCRVVGACMDVTERKRTEDALWEVNRDLETQAALLQSREELLKIFVKSVPAGVAMLDRDMRYLQVSDRWCADYSRDRSQVLGRSHYELFPDVPERWKEMHRRALEGETLRADEDRWEREGGTTTWVRWEIRPWRTPNGIVGGILIFAEDITRRKNMEEALSDMSRKLIKEQERERKRIAREIHDDYNQRLAMLANDLDELSGNLGEADPAISHRLHELWNDVSELGADLHHLSHTMHSSTLENLGLVAGMKAFCEEFEDLQSVEVQFTHNNVPRSIPADVELCLFRVTQEGLRNIKRHSGANQAEIRLEVVEDRLHLSIADRGRGFDVNRRFPGDGIGILSMEERLRALGGQLEIHSCPLEGTRIDAWLRFSATSRLAS